MATQDGTITIDFITTYVKLSIASYLDKHSNWAISYDINAERYLLTFSMPSKYIEYSHQEYLASFLIYLTTLQQSIYNNLDSLESLRPKRRHTVSALNVSLTHIDLDTEPKIYYQISFLAS